MDTARAVNRAQSVNSDEDAAPTVSATTAHHSPACQSSADDMFTSGVSMEDRSDMGLQDCPSPGAESFLSAGSTGLGLADLAGTFRCRMPRRLQLVKPLEGSWTLGRWRSLATPHLARLLEHRPGIQVKGQQLTKDFEVEPHSITDYEEDDDVGVLDLTKDVETYSTFATVVYPTTEHSAARTRISQPSTTTTVQSSFDRSSSVSSSLTNDSVQRPTTTGGTEVPADGKSSEDFGRLTSWLGRLGLTSRFAEYASLLGSLNPLETGQSSSETRGVGGGLGDVVEVAPQELPARTTFVNRPPTHVGLNSVMSMKRVPSSTRPLPFPRRTSKPIDPASENTPRTLDKRSTLGNRFSLSSAAAEVPPAEEALKLGSVSVPSVVSSSERGPVISPSVSEPGVDVSLPISSPSSPGVGGGKVSTPAQRPKSLAVIPWGPLSPQLIETSRKASQLIDPEALVNTPAV